MASVGTTQLAAASTPPAPSGAVYAWGDDDAGQLANGNVTVKGHNYDEKSPEPADMPAGTLAVSLAAGQSHSLAATTTGSVFAWGFNGNGQLGTGNTNATTLPVPVAMPPGANVTSVAAGFKQSYALTSSGQIYAWGLNKDGQLGTGSTKSQSDLPESVESALRGHRDGDRGRGVPRAGGRQRRQHLLVGTQRRRSARRRLDDQLGHADRRDSP